MEWYRKENCTHPNYKILVYECGVCHNNTICYDCVFRYRLSDNHYTCYNCFKRLVFLDMLSGVRDGARKYESLLPPT